MATTNTTDQINTAFIRPGSPVDRRRNFTIEEQKLRDISRYCIAVPVNDTMIELLYKILGVAGAFEHDLNDGELGDLNLNMMRQIAPMVSELSAMVEDAYVGCSLFLNIKQRIFSCLMHIYSIKLYKVLQNIIDRDYSRVHDYERRRYNLISVINFIESCRCVEVLEKIYTIVLNGVLKKMKFNDCLSDILATHVCVYGKCGHSLYVETQPSSSCLEEVEPQAMGYKVFDAMSDLVKSLMKESAKTYADEVVNNLPQLIHKLIAELRRRFSDYVKDAASISYTIAVFVFSSLITLEVMGYDSGPIGIVANSVCSFLAGMAFATPTAQGGMEGLSSLLNIFTSTLDICVKNCAQHFKTFISTLRSVKLIKETALPILTFVLVNLAALVNRIVGKDIIPLQKDMIEDWQKQSREYCKAFHDRTLLLTMQKKDLLESLIERGEYYIKILGHKNDRMPIVQTLVQLREVKKLFLQKNVFEMGLRQEPVSLLLMGEPGLGKSVLMHYFVNAVMAKVLNEHELDEFKENPSMFVYTRQHEHVYWDGYSARAKIVIFDDFLQTKDNDANPDNEVMNFIRAQNSFENILHAAPLEEKGNLVFRSPFVFLNSNRKTFELNSIIQPGAVIRRVDIPIEVRVKEEYCKPGRGENVVIDYEKLPLVDTSEGKVRSITPDVLNYVLCEPSTTTHGFNATNKVLSFDDVVNLLVEKYDLKRSYLIANKIGYMDTLNRYLQTRKLDTREKPMPQGDVLDLFESIPNKRMDPIIILRSSEFNELEERLSHSERFELLHNILTAYRQKCELDPTADPTIVFNSLINTVLDNDIWFEGTFAEVPSVESLLENYDEISDLDKMLAFEEIQLNETLTTVTRTTISDKLRAAFKSVIQFVLGLPDMIVGMTIYTIDMVTLAYKNVHDACAAVITTFGTLETWKYIYWYHVAGAITVAASIIIMFKNIIQFVKTRFFSAQGNIYYGNGVKKIPRKVGRTTTTVVLPQSMREMKQVSDVAISLINKNIFALMVPVNKDGMVDGNHHLMGSMLGIGGRTLLVPYHYGSYLSSYKERGFGDKICYISLAHTATRQYPISITQLLDVFDSNDSLEAQDLGYFKMPQNFQPMKDIRDFFVTEKIVGKGQFKSVLVIPRSELGMVEVHHSTALLKTDLSINDTPEFEGYKISRVFRIQAPTSMGDCGNPLMAADVNGSKIILGVHVAGMAGGFLSGPSYGYSSVVTRELLESVSVDATSFPSAEVDKLIVPQAYVSCYGKMKRFPTMSGKTTLIPSLIVDKVVKRATKPAKLRDFYFHKDGYVERISPKNIAIQHYCKGDLNVDMRALQVAAKIFEKDLFDSLTIEVKPRMLTFDEAVLGLDNEPDFASLNRGTSCGFPDNVRNVDKSKKFYFGDSDQFDLSNNRALSLRKDIAALYDKLSKGERCLFVYTDSLKDEKRPIEKVDAGKTRIFSAASIRFSILCRMAFASFFISCIKNRVENEMLIGVNPHGREWDYMARTLMAGHSVDDECVGAGDFSKFDASHLPFLQNILLEVILQFYKDATPEEQTVRRLLFLEITNSIHVFDGSLYVWNGAMPSGNPLTTLLNCLYNKLAFRYCYVRICHMNSLPVFGFAKHVKLFVMGDDNVFSVSREFSHLFNEGTLPPLMRELGLEYTGDDKAGIERLGLRKLDQVTILKRNIVRHSVDRMFVAPLLLETLLETTNWVHKSAQTLSDHAAILEAILYELTLHPKGVFEYWRDRILQAVKDVDGLIVGKDMVLDYELMYTVLRNRE